MLDLDEYLPPNNGDDGGEAKEDSEPIEAVPMPWPRHLLECPPAADAAFEPAENLDGLVKHLRDTAATSMFYPGGGGDWEPLALYDNCNTFVYCDISSGGGPEAVEQLLSNIGEQHPTLRFQEIAERFSNEEFSEQITQWELFARKYEEQFWSITWGGRMREPKHPINWGLVAKFERATTRTAVKLVFLRAEGFAAYLNIYHAGRVAPRIIHMGRGGGHTGEMLASHGSFGRLISNDHAAHFSLLEGAELPAWQFPFNKSGERHTYSTIPPDEFIRSCQMRDQILNAQRHPYMRYFIDLDGNDVTLEENEFDHVDIARRILPVELVEQLRETADYDGYYTQMFARGYVRAREERDWLMLEAESPNGTAKPFDQLTEAQRRSIDTKAKRFANVSYNSKRFVATREGQAADGNGNDQPEADEHAPEQADNEPCGAFEQAMLDQLADPQRDFAFTMTVTGLGKVHCPTSHFLSLRAEEREIIERSLAGREQSSVLDVGCGIGRHLVYCHELLPEAKITGVDYAPRFLDLCRERMPDGRFVSHFNQLGQNERFDVVLLMGNGLGVFGDEEETQEALERLFGMLNSGGDLVVESGMVQGHAFHAAQHTIEYKGAVDGPFMWNYASSRWLQEGLRRIGFDVLETERSTILRDIYICRARKP